MKTRSIAGSVLVLAALAACGGDSATEPRIDGPRTAPLLQGAPAYPPGLVDNPHAAARDTSRLNNGYFGSGHGTPKDSSAAVIQ